MTTAIDDVVEFFENVILSLTPVTDPGTEFHLLGDDSGLLRDQPKNSFFHRLFDIRFGWDPETGASQMPLDRYGSILIMIGYVGSLKTRKVERVMRQDEELIARHLLMPSDVQQGHVANRPYQWYCRPPHMTESLDESDSATMVVYRYEVHYTCDSV